MEIGKLPSLANQLIEAGDVDGAQAMLLGGLQQEPENAVLWAEAGYFLYQLGSYADAAASLERAGALGDSDIRSAFFLGAARYRLGQLALAETYLRNVVAFDGTYGDSWHILGLALAGQGRFDEALTALRMATDRLDDASAVKDLIWRVKFLRGDWDGAWRDCLAAVPDDTEDRWRAAHGTDHRLWRGEALNGSEIVVFSHGGYGDVINFFRFVDRLIDEGPRRITLLVPQSLHRLIQDSPAFNRPDAPPIDLPGEGQPLDRQPGYFTWFEGLAAHYRANPETGLSKAPYFRADPSRQQEWANRLGQRKGMRIGLVWRGSPAMPEDRWRSLPVEALSPILAVSGHEYYALQGGGMTDEEPAFLVAHGIRDLSPMLTDFAETAAAMVNLDLVISIDSAPAHLAGALGIETWLLNRATSEWRWGWKQPESFWYARMRLFNQPALGDWTSVIAGMADALWRREATLSG